MTSPKLEIVTLVVGQMATNCHLLIDAQSKETLIIDPGDAAEYISDKLQEFACKPKMIVATHGHFDHIMAAVALQQAFQIPFFIHKDDAFLVGQMSGSAQHFLGIKALDPPPTITQTLEDKQGITIGKTSCIVMHTPGHTPGSICLYYEQGQVVFVGDTIFADGGVGRTDFSYSDAKKLTESLTAILALPIHCELRPGHGDKTSVGNERTHHIQ